MLLGTSTLRPVSTLLGVTLGWVVLVGFFRLFGDAISHSAAQWIFGWTVERGYGTGDFGPFYACAWVVSLAGLVLSGFSTSRWCRTAWPAPLLGFVISLEVAVVASVVAVRAQPTPVPHTWFYAIWLALPMWRYIGLVLMPFVVLLGGWFGLSRGDRTRRLR
jgi:hypothetical protein